MAAEVLTLCLGKSSGCLRFSDGLLSEDVVLRWADHLTWLLASSLPSRDHLLGRMPEIPLKQLELAPGIELQEAVNSFAGQQVPFDERPVHKLLMDVGAQEPDAVAVRDGMQTWTYKHLCAAILAWELGNELPYFT